jgi:ribosomal protein L18
MIKKFYANKARLKRHQRMRNRLTGSEGRPRLNVFRSGGHIYAQIIDDTTGRTLVAASSLDESLRNFQPVKKGEPQATRSKTAREGEEASVEMATEAPAAQARGKSAKAEKAPAKGGPQQKGKGKPAQTKTVLPSAQKG